MGKIQFTIGEISGRVGGLVFSRNAAGNYIKPFRKNTNPRTLPQTRERAKLSDLVTSWASITESQRAAWRSTEVTVYDVWGTARTLSGRNLFLSLNRNRQLIEESTMEDPPEDLTLPAMFTNPVTVYQSSLLVEPPWAGGNEISYGWYEPGVTGVQVVSRTTIPLRNTVVNPGHHFLYTKHENIIEDGMPIYDEYFTRHGLWLAEKYNTKFSIHHIIQLVKVTNGTTTTPIQGYCVYGADAQLYP